MGIRTVKHLLVILGGGLVLFGYQNCSKINVKDPFVAGVASGQQVAGEIPDVPTPPSDDGIVTTDPQGDIVTTQVEHPAAPTSTPTTSTPTPLKEDEPVDVCEQNKEDYDNAIDVDQFHNQEVKLNVSSQKRTLIYCSSGRGHVKEINTEDSEGEVVVCNTDVEVLKGKKGKVKLKKSKVRSREEFEGDCHDDDDADRTSTSHDNRDHDFADNSNRNHDKEKISVRAEGKIRK